MKSLIPRSACSTDVRPFGSLAGFSADMDRLFEALRDPRRRPSAGLTAMPPLDWSEGEDGIVLRAEVPGVDPADLEITVHGDVLTIAGETKSETESSEGTTTYSERRFGSFRREIQLPCPIATDAIEAETANGVLTLRLPKSEAARPKRIEVTGS